MKSFGDDIRKNATYFSRTGVFCILLAAVLMACESPDSREVDTAETGDADARQGMTDAYSGSRMMNVSITSSGEIVPTVPGGRTTFAVENTHTEDCNLTLIPQAGGDMMGRDAMGDDAVGEDGLDNETAHGTPPSMTQDADDRAGTGAGTAQNGIDAGAQDGTDQPESALNGANRAGATQGETLQGQSSRVTGGQATTVTVDLEPGLYEVSCTGVDGTDQQGTDSQGANQAGTNQLGEDQERPMLVMVTEDASLGGTTRDGQGAAPGSIERPESDNLGTENE